jgi:hypothetical protein
VLAEVEYDEDGSPLPIPDEIDGKRVVGVEDGQIIGGQLHNEYGQNDFSFSVENAEGAFEWLGMQGWEDTSNLRDRLLSE